MIQIANIKEQFQTRKINQQYVDFLAEDFKKNGFKSAYPVSISKDGVLWDGNHRLAAAKQAGITEIPHIVETPDNMRFEAHERNRVAANAMPETFVDHAEEIWAMLASGKTQKQVADEMGTSKQRISQFAALSNIGNDAWALVSTTILNCVVINEDGCVVKKSTTVDITEGLLRDITCLTPDQQHELVSDLITGNITKGKFKTLAQAYKARDDAAIYVYNILARYVDFENQDLLINAIKEIDAGKYDKEWQGNASHEQTDKLIQSIKDAYDKINSVRLIHGDFYNQVQHIEAGSVDLVITDPPYNIAYDREFQYEGRKNISKDFGDWDKLDHETFKTSFDFWFKEFSRIMKPDSSGFIFTSDVYISHISEALQRHGFTHRSTITWHKSNPGTSTMKDNFISSNEYIVFFRRGKPTFNFSNDNDMQNFISCPVCAGNERVKDPKGEVLHPTQKPQKVIRHLMEISSNIGDLVFDGFMGVGTTAKVAKKIDRKFVGIEMEEKFFKAISLEG